MYVNDLLNRELMITLFKIFNMKKTVVFLFTFLLITSVITSCQTKPVRLFASGYNASGEKALAVYDLSMESGIFKKLSESDAGKDPSYFCISEKNGLIYAANEVMEFNGVKGGGITTLTYNPETGSTEKVNALMVPKGGPCFITLSPAGDYLLLANYSSSSIAIVKLDPKGIPETVTDTISFPANEGSASHPHMIAFDPAGKKVYLTDLGLDRIVIYDFDQVAGVLRQIPDGIVNFSKGAGPRHFVFNQSGSKMYVICELNSTISVFDVNSNGGLNTIQTLSTLGETYTGENACADIHLAKSGQYLYGSNRGENTIVVFGVGTDGKLSFSGRTSCGGNWPRNFVIDPTDNYILVGNQKSGEISLFKIDQKTGIPNYINDTKFVTPSCLKFADKR
jgi:6-phosphogluconolactonase